MKKWIVIGTAGIALAVGAGAMLSMNQISLAKNNASVAQIEPTVVADSRVVATGKIVPLASVDLHFASAGTVAELLVKEGDTVQANAPLARLDQRSLALQHAQAQADLDHAQAQYDLLAAGASPDEIAAAKAQVAQSQAQAQATGGTVTANDLKAAQARVDEARALLAQLAAGPTTTEQAAAQAKLDQAKASQQQAQDSLSAAKTQAQAAMEQAANALRDQQAAYQQVVTDNQRAGIKRSGTPAAQRQQALDREAAAQRAMQNADYALSQAQVAYDAAKQAEIAGNSQAEAATREAQATLDALVAGSKPDALAAARAQLAQAQADYAKLTGNQRTGNVAAAQADVQQSQAKLQQIEAGPRTEELAVAKASIAAATVALQQADLALSQATLVAPISGTVVLVNLKVGENAAADQVAVVVADLSHWQIETTDLSELNVARVREQAPVAITFDAVPGLTINGTVTRIKQRGETQQGEMTYVAIITPSTQDPRLRWNMTTSVAIQPAQS